MIPYSLWECCTKTLINFYSNFYMYVAHYAFYEACILCGCDMSTGFFIRICGYGHLRTVAPRAGSGVVRILTSSVSWPWYVRYFPTFMARYSLFVRKVPLRKQTITYGCAWYCHWCGLRPSVLGQDRSETKNWSWSCRSGVVLWNTVLSRSSS